MGQYHHDTGLVGAGIDLQTLADADKAGMIIALVLNRSSQIFKIVKLSAGPA